MLKLSYCDYSDEYILVEGTIKITGHDGHRAAKIVDERNKDAIFEL